MPGHGVISFDLRGNQILYLAEYRGHGTSQTATSFYNTKRLITDFFLWYQSSLWKTKRIRSQKSTFSLTSSIQPNWISPTLTFLNLARPHPTIVLASSNILGIVFRALLSFSGWSENRSRFWISDSSREVTHRLELYHDIEQYYCDSRSQVIRIFKLFGTQLSKVLRVWDLPLH